MKNFIKGALLISCAFSTMILGMVGFLLYSGAEVKYRSLTMHLNLEGIQVLFWICLVASCGTFYIMAPLYLQNTFWDNEKTFQKKLNEVEELKRTLQRKIDKL